MKKLIKISLFSLLSSLMFILFSCNEQIPKANLTNNIDSVSYAQGVLYASQVKEIFAQLKLDEANKSDFIKGFRKGFQIDPKNKKENALMVGKIIGYQIAMQVIPYFNEQLFGDNPTQTMNKENLLTGYITTVKNDSNDLFTREEARAYSMKTMDNIRKATTEERYKGVKKENLDFLEKNKSKKRVVVLPSGLQYKVIKEGKGPKPGANDIVRIDYREMNIKGEVFHNSIERGNPEEFSLNEVIKGWKEGIQLMSVGSKYIFYIPYYLAYGDMYRGNVILPYSTIIFEVELREIVKSNRKNGKS